MRPRGGIIGATVQPAFIAASGIWSLREATEYRSAGKWVIPGLICNLDASVLSSLKQNSNGTTAASATDDPVGYWADQTGLGNHATQATSGSRPKLKLSNQNGLPGIELDGTDDYLIASVSGFNQLQNTTILMVLKTSLAAAADTNSGFFWCFGNIGASSGSFPERAALFCSSSSAVLSGEKIVIGRDSAGEYTNQNSPRFGSSSYSRAANNAQLLSLSAGTSGLGLAANNLEVPLNLASETYSISTASGPSVTGYTVDNNVLLGALRSSGNIVIGPSVTYHQILAFNRVISSQERADIWNELRVKWAIV